LAARHSRCAGARVEVRLALIPRRTISSRLRHLADVRVDQAGRAETHASGAAYVLLFPEPLERFVPLHGQEEKR
jgi:hypothetical protein